MFVMYWGLTNGGGIGEAMVSSGNIAARPERIIFDLLFFVVVLVLELNVVFGIIIDTFSQLREEHRQRQEFINNKCLICNIQRSEFDASFAKRGIQRGFQIHTKLEHYLWHYFWFIVHIRITPNTDYTGVEQFVSQSLDDDDASWIPSEMASSLQVSSGEENERRGEQGMNRFMQRFEQSMASDIKSVRDNVKKVLERMKERPVGGVLRGDGGEGDPVSGVGGGEGLRRTGMHGGSLMRSASLQ